MYTNEFRRLSFYSTMVILLLVYLFYGHLEKPWEENPSVKVAVFALGLLHCFLTLLRCIAHFILHRKLEKHPDVAPTFSTLVEGDAPKAKADQCAEEELDLILAYHTPNTHKRAHARAHARTHSHVCTHTRARTLTRTHARTHAHIHARTHAHACRSPPLVQVPAGLWRVDERTDVEARHVGGWAA
jgi:hypothetical protein